MSNSNTEVNVTVSTPDEVQDAKIKKWRQQERKVVQELRTRIFFVKSQGGQRYYYDVEKGANSLTVQHLIGIVGHEMKKFDPEWQTNPTSSTDSVREELRNAHFHPIVLQSQYRPYEEVTVFDEGLYFPNVWRKPDVVPTEYISVAKARSKKSGAAPFVQHVQRMLGDTEMDLDHPESKAGYLIRMLAFRYQKHDFRKTEKPHVAFYFYGKQGMGKGVFGRTLEAVFGSTAVMTVPDERSLTSMSSVDVFSRTWAVVDEVNIAKGSTNYNTIKTHTGSTHTSSARKGEHFRPWYIPAQLMMFSQKSPTFIEAGDRRFFISHWETEFDSPQAKDDYFRGYTNWLHDEGGFEAIAGLLRVTDVSKVRPESPAMTTQEKQQVVAMVTDDAVQDIIEKVEGSPERICWTEEDFSEIFHEQSVNRKQYGYKMEEAGLVEQMKRKYEGKRSIKFYLRKGWEIRIVNGEGSWLQNASDTAVRRSLKDDYGYIAAITRKKPEF